MRFRATTADQAAWGKDDRRKHGGRRLKKASCESVPLGQPLDIGVLKAYDAITRRRTRCDQKTMIPLLQYYNLYLTL